MFLSPLVLTGKTLRLVDTYYLSALRAGPLLLFLADELTYAERPDLLQIVHHAHAIIRSISFVQIFKSGAGKAVAIETVLNVGTHQLLTVLDTALYAGFRLEAIATPAAGACLSLSDICATEAAVHSAGCDLRRTNHVCLCRSVCHLACIL